MFWGMCPVDKDAIKCVSAMSYLNRLKDDELDELDRTYVLPDQRDLREQKRKEIDTKFKKKELALLRHMAGPLAKIVDEK